MVVVRSFLLLLVGCSVFATTTLLSIKAVLDSLLSVVFVYCNRDIIEVCRRFWWLQIRDNGRGVRNASVEVVAADRDIAMAKMWLVDDHRFFVEHSMLILPLPQLVQLSIIVLIMSLIVAVRCAIHQHWLELHIGRMKADVAWSNSSSKTKIQKSKPDGIFAPLCTDDPYLTLSQFYGHLFIPL